MAEEADAQFRNEVRCLAAAQAECANKAAEQMQEMRVVQSEGQLQQSSFESQTAALRSQVSGLQEAIVQREAQARELQDRLQMQKQMLEDAGAQFRHEARCLDEVRAIGRETAAEQRLELRVLHSEEQMQRSAWESQNVALHSEISVLQEANAQRDVRARELHGQLHKQEQTAEEADSQFRHEVRCLQDVRMECASKTAEEMQEMRVVLSERQLQRSAWASQNAALHSKISALQEAKAQQDARAHELQGQLHKQEQTAEEANAQLRHEVRCLEDVQAECANKAAEQMQEMRVVQSEGQLQRSALESQTAALRSQVSGLREARCQWDIQLRELEAALLQAEAHAAEQKGQFMEQQHSLEVAEVQLHLKLEMCEATESRTKHQHVQAESRELSVECQELNTKWLGATETIGCLELDMQKLESQAERLRAEADAHECLVASEREESTYKQALAASRAASYEQEEDLCQMRQKALESQNEALQSWCSSLQEQNLQLQSVRTQDEMRWLSECRETDLLRQRLLEAHELQAGASGREPTLCEEVSCLREANAAFEDTVGEIKCRHRQMQEESERRRSECEELTACWLSACEEVDSMQLGMWQLKAQVENAQKKSEQLVVDCKAFKKERAESHEQSARLQLQVRQCRTQLAALQQEVVMEGLSFVRPDSQVQRTIWESRNAEQRSQVPGIVTVHQAARAAQAYELPDQLQTDKQLSEEVQAAEQLRRFSRQSFWGPAGGHTTTGSTRSSGGVCRCRMLLRNACLVIWRHWTVERKYAQRHAVTLNVERWPLALAFTVWARSSETATFRIRHGLRLLYAAVLSAQRRCLLQATRCLLGRSKDTVLVALTDAASAQSDRTYQRRRSVVDRFVVGHLPARRRVLELALRAWRDASCTYQTCGNQTGRQPSALQSKDGRFSHVDEIRTRVCESKPKTKASIPTMPLLQAMSAWRGVVRARRARNKS
ncbi:unnamed protein product [Symbiodinium sp. CCMP2456]|nr:unnamed protein product [Symbiodinium sp. CCMP2456]